MPTLRRILWYPVARQHLFTGPAAAIGLAMLLSAFTLGRMSDARSAEPADRPAASPAAAALRSIFSVTAAPPQKTMGLLQRSFLDIAHGADEGLEIALVIDGTASMEAEIDGIRQAIAAMIEDLQRNRRGAVRVAVVVYRDSGAPSGTVTILQDRFSDDIASLQKVLEQIQPESGAPFFHELPDVGVHVALDQLSWSDDPNTTRWVFLFGDAPPFAESFATAEIPQARRQYATDLLVALAARKQIQIHCILCTSSESLQSSYQQAVPETRGFMNALATGTGGLMLDLSYPDIRQAIIAAGSRPRYEYVTIDPITQEDLAAARQAAANGSAEADPVTTEVRVAVLPHLPIHAMSFDPREPAVQVATCLHHKLENLPRVRVASPYDVERHLRRLRAEGLSETQQLRALAARLGVDYVVWGQLDPAGSPIVSAVYSGRGGEQVLQVAHSGEVTQLASVILNASTADERFGKLRTSQHGMPADAVSQQLQKPLARNASATRELLAALGALQQSLGLLADDRRSDQLLAIAQTAAEAVLVTEPNNGLAHWLLANVHFNRATRALAAGEMQTAQERSSEMTRALGRAYRNRRDIGSLSLVSEVVSDHLFLVDRDIAKAVEHYESLTGNPKACPSVRRRAHWMLTGIYGGDWGVDAKYVDVSKARQHAIAILANWETSPEAMLLRQWLGWNPETNRTEHPHLPRAHHDLAQAPADMAPPS